MGIKCIITFTREPVDCDLAEWYCPVSKPCNQCNEYFNSMPILERAKIEIPRRIGLLTAYGYRAFFRGQGTLEEIKRYKRRKK